MCRNNSERRIMIKNACLPWPEECAAIRLNASRLSKLILFRLLEFPILIRSNPPFSDCLARRSDFVFDRGSARVLDVIWPPTSSNPFIKEGKHEKKICQPTCSWYIESNVAFECTQTILRVKGLSLSTTLVLPTGTIISPSNAHRHVHEGLSQTGAHYAFEYIETCMKGLSTYFRLRTHSRMHEGLNYDCVVDREHHFPLTHAPLSKTSTAGRHGMGE
jgi:hypothetical protein